MLSNWKIPPCGARRRAAAALAALLALPLSMAPGQARAAVAQDAPAPDFTLPSSQGANLRLREQRGQVVLINFWATWCGPCRREMPELNRIYGKYRPAGFVLLGVNVDEDPDNARGVASRIGVQFPVLFDSHQAVSRLYDLGTMPSSVLIDRDGRVRGVFLGYKDGYERQYEKQIAELLRE
jgi:peroxiredoxin